MRTLRNHPITRHFAPTLTAALTLWLALVAAATVTGRL